ncbi:pyridoxamine 5'-phosphate oxidase family protein [Mesorhizobium kowhaii]|nr:pyridoxamine 5'-phosphate oxidase family protein [Mesorhizobium kowhaii]
MKESLPRAAGIEVLKRGAWVRQCQARPSCACLDLWRGKAHPLRPCQMGATCPPVRLSRDNLAMPRTFDPDDVLSRPLMANLATVSADGAPRNAPVWFIWEDGAIWLLGSSDGSAVKHLLRDPRCAVEIVHFDNNAGILLHLGLRGAATIEPMSPDRFNRLLHKYLGPEASWNEWFIDNVAQIEHPDGRMIRLAPVSIFTNNVSFFRTGPDFAWPP